jgi:hypothetical protein
VRVRNPGHISLGRMRYSALCFGGKPDPAGCFFTA